MSVVSDIIIAGTAAGIPAASSANDGYLYFETDTLLLKRSNGSAWVQVAAAASLVGPFTKADGSVAFTGDQSMGSHKLTNVTDPASAQDAATKAYVDGIAVNLGKRARVRAATTANITIATALNNADTLDGVTLATGDLVLVKNQSAAEENGVYVVGVSPARSSEFDTYDEHPGSLIAVQEGTANADTAWLCTSNVGGTLNTTAINFSSLATGGGTADDLDIGGLPGDTPTSGDLIVFERAGTRYQADVDDLPGGGGGSPNWLGLITFAYPSSFGWTWDNQGSGTIDSAAGWEYQYCPAKGAVQLQLRYRTPANSHYRIDAAFLVEMHTRNTAGDGGLFFGFRDSGGKIEGFMDFSESGNTRQTVYKWNASNSVSAATSHNLSGPTLLAALVARPVFLRIEYDGTNINFYRSADAYHYELAFTSTLTTFLGSGTPNVCWGAYCNAGNFGIALIHYVETALP